MKHLIQITIVIALLANASFAVAQSGSAKTDVARQDSVVSQAMRVYQDGLAAIKDATNTASSAQPGATSGAFRELTLEESVTLALDKNLEIAVARLDPQSVDYLVAGYRNTYRPNFNTTIGHARSVRAAHEHLERRHQGQ